MQEIKQIKALVVASGFALASREPIEKMQAQGIQVIEHDYGPGGLNDNPDEFCRIIKDADILIATALERIPRKILAASRNLKMVALRSAGFDKFDLEAATQLGILGTHNPGANRQSVADMALGLMLGVGRRIAWMDRGMRSGKYNQLRVKSKDLTGSTVGIIGLGRIGKETALRAKAFSTRVIYHDLLDYQEFARKHGIEKVTLDYLLSVSDFVSIHLPLDESTRCLIGRDALEKMKSSAVLVNTARGGIVDEKEVCLAVKNSHLYGYGVDVFEEEPPANNALLQLDNVLATPHMAGVSENALHQMAMATADKVLCFMIAGKIPEDVLNPEVINKLQP